MFPSTQQLFHERASNAALTFTQNPNASQQAIQHAASPTLGKRRPDDTPAAEAAALLRGLSVLGSIIPGLDPDPPNPAKRRRLPRNADTPLTGSRDERPRLSPPSPPALGVPSLGPDGREGGAASGECRERPARGLSGSGIAGAVAGGVLVGGSAVGAGSGRREGKGKGKADVKHGLRVLLRGSARCGKSTILWDYCHRAALAGHRVALVCLPRSDDDMPHLPRSMHAGGARDDEDELRGWEASALAKIGMKYVQSCEDLAWYLSSIHRLPRREWPTVIAVDDVDKIVEKSVAGAGAGASGGSLGAALRIFALLQNTAEFFDSSRAAESAVSTSASTSPDDDANADANADAQDAEATRDKTPPPPTRPPFATGSSANAGTSGEATTPPSKGKQRQYRGMETETETGGKCDTPPSANACQGAPATPLTVNRLEGAGGEVGLLERRGKGAGVRGREEEGGEGKGVAEEAVRVVGTCSTSDRGLLSLCGRFVHVVARVQNTTGPDWFSLKVDPGIGTACPLLTSPPPGPARTPQYGGRGVPRVGDDGHVAAEAVVEFVRSQADGSFALC